MQAPQNPRELRLVDRPSPPQRDPVATEGPSLTLGDIYFTLFRHKGKIIIGTLLGLIAAALFYKVSPRIYQSEAKLFIRYVMESQTPGRTSDDRSVKSPDPQGLNILSSELEIITSLDLVAKVVDNIGVEKFAPLKKDGKDRDRAIYEVSQSFQAQIPARSTVLQLSFAHRDPTIVQPVLREFINCYLKKHVEIHRSTGLVDDFLTQETEQLRNRLSQTEEDLRKANNKLGYPSIDEAKKALNTLSSRLRQDIYDAENQLAERTAFIRTLEQSTRTTDTSASESTAPIQTAPLSDNVISAYNRTLTRLDSLRKTEQDLLLQFTPEYSRVKETRAQLEEAEGEKKKQEAEFPSLAILRRPQPQPTAGNQILPPTTDLVSETARVSALRSKIEALNEQFKKLRLETSKVDQMEAEIIELTRKKELEESNYRKYAASLEQARLDEAMSSGHVSNISEVQAPSLPIKGKSKRMQIIMMLAICGAGISIAWAFAVDLFLDKTIKRPIEIERKLNLPLLLSIPEVNKSFVRRMNKARRTENMATADLNPKPAEKGLYLAKGDQTQVLQPFHATLRDRLVQYFDDHNLTHKPKMIAVTGLSKHAGVTTTATGLAQSLSETGEGNVLLVDMTAEQGSAQHYIKGKAVSSLEETLETKERALVQENLYVVSESSNSDRLARNLPQRFAKLVPKLKASDFDYIIFDLPQVSQISVTPRLASLMDLVLLVVESEKTTPETVEKCAKLLSQANVHIGLVLNKTRNHIPFGLTQESINDV